MPCDLTSMGRKELAAMAKGFLDNDTLNRDTIEDFIQKACVQFFPTPTPDVKTLMGVNWAPDVPGTASNPAKLDAFEAKTKKKVGTVRVYPAGKTGVDGLSGAKAVLAIRPGVSQVISSLVTGRNIDVVALAKAHQAHAQALKAPLWALMDAEPERERKRIYTEDQWCTQYLKWVDAHDEHAPAVHSRTLNLTGYQFKARIERFKSVWNEIDIIAVDPYWRIGTNAIQATEQDLDDAYEFAKAHNMKLAWGEWGIDPGTGHADRLARAQHYLTKTKPVWAPYFQLIGAWDSRLLSDTEFNGYANLLQSI